MQNRCHRIKQKKYCCTCESLNSWCSKQKWNSSDKVLLYWNFSSYWHENSIEKEYRLCCSQGFLATLVTFTALCALVQPSGGIFSLALFRDPLMLLKTNYPSSFAESCGEIFRLFNCFIKCACSIFLFAYDCWHYCYYCLQSLPQFWNSVK